MPGMPTVTRSGAGNPAPSSTRVFTKRSGGSGYGVGTRCGCVRIVPLSSSTEPLIPPPPQSMASVVFTTTVCPLAASDDAAAHQHGQRERAGEEGQPDGDQAVPQHRPERDG